MLHQSPTTETLPVPPVPPVSEASPRVLIIIVCFNQVDLTLACLASLEKLSYLAADVLIVDNASSDGTVEQVQQQFPQAAVMASGENLGYAGGNNLGLRYALEHDYAYALLLNNDTEVAPDFVTQLVDICEQDGTVAAAGPKTFFFDRPNVLWAAGGCIDWRAGGRTSMRGFNEADTGLFNQVEDVDFAPGCALLVRLATVADVGLLDERFGMYYEETEWCVRMKRAGHRVVYVPTSKVWHKVQLGRHEWTPYVTYYMARNRLLFLRLTHASMRTWLVAILVQDLRTWLSWRLRRKWRGRAAQRVAMGKGWRDFLRGRFGMAW